MLQSIFKIMIATKQEFAVCDTFPVVSQKWAAFQ
jgi:hypothetical protein